MQFQCMIRWHGSFFSTLILILTDQLSSLSRRLMSTIRSVTNAFYYVIVVFLSVPIEPFEFMYMSQEWTFKSIKHIFKVGKLLLIMQYFTNYNTHNEINHLKHTISYYKSHYLELGNSLKNLAQLNYFLHLKIFLTL